MNIQIQKLRVNIGRINFREMRSSTDKMKLKLMHQVLDKELESINNEPAFKTYDNLRSSNDRMKDSIDSRGSVERSKNGQFKELTNSAASRKNEINDLQKKLMELEKKMECIDLESSDSQNNAKETAVQHRLMMPSGGMQNSSAKKRGFDRKNQLESYDVKTEENRQQQEQESQEQDSDDNYIPGRSSNQPVQKIFTNNLKKIVNKGGQPTNLAKNNNVNRSLKKPSTTQEDQDNLLGQRYSQKDKRKSEDAKNKLKISDTSKRSKKNDKENQNRNIHHRAFSNQKSLRHNQSHKSFNSNRSRSNSQGKDNSRISVSAKSMKNQDLQVNKQIKRITNLQKELTHYKRLSKKLQQKVTEMQKVQIQYRKLKVNFAKSQQIRKQQKKLIENLRTRKNQV